MNPTRPPSCPVNTQSLPDAWPHHGGRRKVHHLPCHGARCRGCRRSRPRGQVPACCTEDVPLLGAEGYQALWNARDVLAAESGLPVQQVERLLNRYGSLLLELLELLKDRPPLASPIDGADGYLAVEAVYAASHEGALHLDDILARRTRISIETWDRGVQAAAHVAALVAPCWAGVRPTYRAR